MSLYDVRCDIFIPHASITSSDTFTSKHVPVVVSQSCEQDVVVCTSGELAFITDNGSTISKSLELESCVDAVTWSHDGNYVAVADSMGFVHVLSKSSSKILYSKQLVMTTQQDTALNPQEKPCFSCIGFTPSRKSDLYNLALATLDGKIFIFENVDLQSLSKDLASNESQPKKTLDQNIIFHTWNVAPYQDKVFSLFSYYNDFETSYFTSGSGRMLLASWENENQIFSPKNTKDSTYTYTLSVEEGTIQDLTKNDKCTAFVKLTQAFSNLFALDNQGHLYQFGLPLLVLVKYWPDVSFQDFVIKMPCSPLQGSKLSYVYGVVNDPTTGAIFFSIFKLQTLEQVYSIPCSGQSLAIASAYADFQDLFFAEFGVSNEGKKGFLIKSVGEASPDSRILLLLQQHKYKEALKFAYKFNLDKQPVYQQEASFLLNSMSTIVDVKLLESNYEELKLCVSKITDAVFVGELCSNITLNNLSFTFKILTLAQEHLDSGGRTFRASVSNGEPDIELQLRLEVDRLLDLLVTFQIAFEDANALLWQQFSTKPLSEEVAKLLVSGNFQAATVICARHENQLVEYLEEDGETRLQNLLKVISVDANTDDLIIWLNHIIPFILSSSIPRSKEILVSWLLNRAGALEELFPDKWPENGLKLANTFFNVQKRLTNIGFIREHLSATSLVFLESEVAPLRLFVSRLQLLSRLQSRYHCKISLDELIKETTLSLTFRLLDKVAAPELYKTCLETTVRPYMREHQLNGDETLFQYVENLLSKSRIRAWGTFRSLSERKGIAIIECLEDTKVFIESAILLSKQALIPWSDRVNAIVKQALKLTEAEHHKQDADIMITRRQKLLHGIHLEKVPAIAAKYDLNEAVQCDNFGLERFVRLLIKHDSVEALRDAVEIARTFTSVPEERIYIYRINLLIKQEKIDECVDILEQFPQLSVNLVKHTIVRSKIILQSTHSTFASNRINHCLATINMIKYMFQYSKLVPNSLHGEWTEDLDIFESIHNLQIHHGEMLTVENFIDEDCRDALLTRNVVQYYRNKPVQPVSSAVVQSNVSVFSEVSDISLGNSSVGAQSINKSSSSDDLKPSCQSTTLQGQCKSFAGILNLARLLKVPHKTMQCQIALKAAKKCQAEAALEICKNLYFASPTPTTATILQKIALTLLTFLESHPNQITRLISDIQEMVCSACTCCDKNELLDAVTLFNMCTLFRNVQRVTEESIQDFLSKCMTSGPKGRRSNYEHIGWLHSWYDYEENDGLTLPCSEVSTLMAKYQECMFNDHGQSLLTLQPAVGDHGVLFKLAENVMKMTRLLKNARRCTMALEWVLKTLFITITHLFNHRAFYCDHKGLNSVGDLILQTVNRANAERQEYIEILVEKILLARNPDVPYAVGLMLDLPSDQAFRVLDNICQSSRKNFERISAIARTGLTVSCLRGMLTETPRYELLLLDAKWARELDALKISVESVFCTSQQWQRSFLPTLINHPLITGTLLLDYCKDYKLNCDRALLQFVIILLGGDTPRAEDPSKIASPGTSMMQLARCSPSSLISFDSSSFKSSQNSYNNSPVERGKPWNKIKEELKWVMEHVENKYEMLRNLERCLEKIMCPYDYDKAEFILQLMLSCSSATEGVVDVEKGLKLIGYLRHFKREQNPSDHELRHFYGQGGKRNVTTTHFPELGHTRLPLHPLLYGNASQAWKILSEEISENSAKFLAPIARLLNLNEDKLYMTAAENLIVRYNNANAGDDKCKFTSKQLEQVQALTEKISSIKMAVALAKRLSEILPISREKVDAYKWCLSLVEKWHDSLKENSANSDHITTVRRTLVWSHKQVDTELTINEHGLSSPETKSLINQPRELIVHLYRHPTIVQRFYEPGDKYPDIHAAVNHIAEVHQQDIAKLRLTMILNLLFAANHRMPASDKEDSTVNIARLRSAALVKPENNHEDVEEIIRLLYLLDSDLRIKQAKYLVKVINDHKNRNISNACKLRAFNCVFYLLHEDELSKLAGKPVNELRADLRTLVYLTELESVNFKVSDSHLRQSDKSSVVRSLIAFSTRQHNPIALRTAAEMCREFGSVQADTWAVILQQLVTMQQIQYLQQLLPDITRIPAVRSLPSLATVWQACVVSPLVVLTAPLNKQQREVAFASYSFLLRCPVLLRIDLRVVAEHFIVLKCHILALGCFLLSPSTKADATALAKSSLPEIRNELGELHDQSLLGLVSINRFLRSLE